MCENNIQWCPTSEAILVDLWHQKFNNLHDPHKNEQVYAEMQSKLNAKGYTYSEEEIRKKLEDLQQQFLHEKSKIELDASSPTSWVHYNKIHNINTQNFAAENHDESMLSEDEAMSSTFLDAEENSFEMYYSEKTGNYIKRKRNIKWTPITEGILLELWQEKIWDLCSVRKNVDVYAEMISKFEEKGFIFNKTQIETKIKTLQYKYRSEKEKLELNAETQSSWEHYDKVKEIMTHYENIMSAAAETENNADKNNSNTELMIRKKKNRILWIPESELILLELWQEHGARNNELYVKIQNELHKKGYTFSVKEILSKSNNLIRKYKHEKVKNAGLPSSWEHYETMSKILYDPDDLNAQDEHNTTESEQMPDDYERKKRSKNFKEETLTDDEMSVSNETSDNNLDLGTYKQKSSMTLKSKTKKKEIMKHFKMDVRNSAQQSQIITVTSGCRTCGKNLKTTEALNIFDENHCHIREQIELLSGIELPNAVGFPDCICKRCQLDLEQSIAFRECCIETQQRYQLQLYDINVGGGGGSKVHITNEDDSSKSEIHTDSVADDPLEILCNIKQEQENEVIDNDYEDTEDTEDTQLHNSNTADNESSEEVEEDDLLTETFNEDHTLEQTQNNSTKDYLLKQKKRVCDNVKRRKYIKHKPHIAPKKKKRYEEICMCDQCGKSFIGKRSLALHQLRHIGVKNFQCEHCDMRFYTDDLLKLHMHKHNNPFKCTYCDMTFGYNSSRVRHERIHRNERPFQCHYCEKAFYCSKSAKEHENTHIGLRNFECKICGLWFLSYANRNSHYRTKIHKDTELKLKEARSATKLADLV